MNSFKGNVKKGTLPQGNRQELSLRLISLIIFTALAFMTIAWMLKSEPMQLVKITKGFSGTCHLRRQ